MSLQHWHKLTFHYSRTRVEAVPHALGGRLPPIAWDRRQSQPVGAGPQHGREPPAKSSPEQGPCPLIF